MYFCMYFKSHGQIMGKYLTIPWAKNTKQSIDNQIVSKMEINPSAYEPILKNASEQVFLRAFLDIRRKKNDGTYPIYVRVTYQGEKWLHATGVCVSDDDYAKIFTLKNGSSPLHKAKSQVTKAFNKIYDAVVALNAQKKFTFENLKKAIANPETKPKETPTLLEYWMEFGESKKTEKTRLQYSTALKNFYRFLGCSVATITLKKRSKEKTIVVKGKKSKIYPSYVDETVIMQWEASMDQAGLSDSTKSIYLRALRAVMNSLGQRKIIDAAPKFTIKQGSRRKEDYIPVSDIVKIRDYKGPGKKAADWWLILYLCNGSNLKDLAYLEWNDDYFYNNELTYIRGKIAGKVKVTVHIPITEPLQKLLDKYASKPVKGKRVFPQILLKANTEADMESRTHDFNRQIRKGMQGVCARLGIRPVTASTARNSYITTLTWHGTQDAFIDAMVGHVDSKNVLRGYQGTISPKKRLKVNNLLFVDPEIDEDDE